MRTTKVWCSNHGGQIDHRLRLPGTAYRRALVRSQPSRLRHDSLHGEGRRVASAACNRSSVTEFRGQGDGVPGTGVRGQEFRGHTSSGDTILNSCGTRSPRSSEEFRGHHTQLLRDYGVPGTPYSTPAGLVLARSGSIGVRPRQDRCDRTVSGRAFRREDPLRPISRSSGVPGTPYLRSSAGVRGHHT